MTDSVAEDMLRSGYDRWCRLEDEKDAIGEDLKALFAELKGQGFTPKALRESFRRVRNISDVNQQEHDAIVDLYVASLTGARRAHTRESAESVTSTGGRLVAAAREMRASIGDEITKHSGAQIIEGITEALAVARGEAEPFRIHEPQPETAAQSRADTIEPQGITIDGPLTTSFAGTEGDEGQHPIQPETAKLLNTVTDAMQTDAGRTALLAAIDVMIEREEATNPASTSPQNSLAEEGSSITTTPAAPLDSFRQPDPAPAPRKQWGFNDPAHPGCLNPFQCGGFSNLGLCGKCKEAAGLPVAKTGGLTA